MQLDSHRRQLSFTVPVQPLTPIATASTQTITKSPNMPCPRSFCSKPVTFKNEDGVEMQTWFSVRRENLHSMRRMVKRVVLYMALIEAIRHGPGEMVFAGKQGFPERTCEDFGIAYYAGYILSWLYLCVFMVVWVPLFSWWVSPLENEGDTSKKVDKVATFLTQVNMVLLPLSISLSLAEYVYHLIMTFIYVDHRPVEGRDYPKNTQKNWLARVMLLVGIAISTTFGAGIFSILGASDLAHVKSLEYFVIVVPIQINLGILMGSGMQHRMEKRIERKQSAVKAIEIGTVDEKQALIAV